MSKREKNLWQAIDASAQDALSSRNYGRGSFAEELSQRGVDANELIANSHKREVKEAWIPGVEILGR